MLHRINGFLVVEFIDNGPHARREGLLGIQIHGGNNPFLNEFKDIFLKRFSTRFGFGSPRFSVSRRCSTGSSETGKDSGTLDDTRADHPSMSRTRCDHAWLLAAALR